MKKIKLPLGKRSYNIWIDNNILIQAGGIIKKLNLAKAAYVITNSKIKSIYGKKLRNSLVKSGMEVKFSVVPDSEKSKSYTRWFKVLKNLANFDKGKGVVVIALGGGVVGDLGGFVASTYRRGVPFIQIPTTLLGQVDSAIGGKVAIDIDCAKNLIGAFYQPKAVISDISALKTLPSRQIRNGLAETIKYGIILDRKFFLYLENNISKILKLDPCCMEYVVSRCSRLKAQVVSADEYEKSGFRSILNFGHTIGHAIEAASSYRKSVNHGEAISVGMLCAFDIAVSLGLVKEAVAKRVEALIKKALLPVKVKGLSAQKIISATAFDKKILKGKKRWILPVDIGHVIVCEKVPSLIIKRAIEARVTP